MVRAGLVLVSTAEGRRGAIPRKKGLCSGCIKCISTNWHKWFPGKELGCNWLGTISSRYACIVAVEGGPGWVGRLIKRLAQEFAA